ncbi:hypothetical protein BHE74_00018550 [Ensete ventricosum]|nr:hypothetical protein BHE74_00018550 [Ensete ventricosum]
MSNLFASRRSQRVHPSEVEKTTLLTLLHIFSSTPFHSSRWIIPFLQVSSDGFPTGGALIMAWQEVPLQEACSSTMRFFFLLQQDMQPKSFEMLFLELNSPCFSETSSSSKPNLEITLGRPH